MKKNLGMLMVMALAVVVLLLAMGCEDEGWVGDCKEACRIQKICAEENEVTYSEFECKEDCRIYTEKVQFADCEEDYKAARNCMLEELDDDDWCDTGDDNYTDAIDECEDDWEDFHDCMEDYQG